MRNAEAVLQDPLASPASAYLSIEDGFQGFSSLGVCLIAAGQRVELEKMGPGVGGNGGGGLVRARGMFEFLQGFMRGISPSCSKDFCLISRTCNKCLAL